MGLMVKQRASKGYFKSLLVRPSLPANLRLILLIEELFEEFTSRDPITCGRAVGAAVITGRRSQVHRIGWSAKGGYEGLHERSEEPYKSLTSGCRRARCVIGGTGRRGQKQSRGDRGRDRLRRPGKVAQKKLDYVEIVTVSAADEKDKRRIRRR
ncbi:hypothetical protein QJS10_CPA08g01864 [Acorus calamus]|uniref:Uncharacterized protein n=1 Tax=Acorus calamus TaxID=4465 RepID=A0AAV9EBB2_ACOCL|nr:hypothetical protein QJS10_CPA08g01864 [Acorus calamus]